MARIRLATLLRGTPKGTFSVFVRKSCEGHFNYEIKRLYFLQSFIKRLSLTARERVSKCGSDPERVSGLFSLIKKLATPERYMLYGL